MCTMLLSINPEHVANILNGKKKFEFRKVRCRSDVDKIIIYATSPIMKVVAEVDIIEILEDTPDFIWESTAEYSGISRSFFDSYYHGKQTAVAYKLGAVTPYKQPKPLTDYGITFAPQSFVYVY